MEEPKYYFICKASDIIPYIPLLDKYFGYTAGYFSFAIQDLLHKGDIAPEEDFDVRIPYYVKVQEIIGLYSKYFKEPINPQLSDILVFISNLTFEDSLGKVMDSMQDTFEEMYCADEAREEFLEFYVWWKSRKNNGTIRIMSKGEVKGFNLENRMGWFDNMIEDYHKQFYSDITSVDQAKQILNKEKRGRKSSFESHNVKTIIYGLSQLMRDYGVTTSPYSTNLCRFICEYLVLIRFCTVNDPYNTPTNVKAKISNVLRGQEDVPKFYQMGEAFTVKNLEELKNIGTRKF